MCCADPGDLALPRSSVLGVAVLVLAFGTARAQSLPDSSLVAELAAIHETDQGGRFEWRRIRASYPGPVPDSVRTAFWDAQNQLDAENLVRVESIIAARGWPGRSLAGEDGARTVFLVVQHASLETQERYLPLLEAAVSSGEAEPWQLAMLTDRVLVRWGLPQRYGTQYRIDPETGAEVVEPIEDPEELEARRAAIGLPTESDRD